MKTAPELVKEVDKLNSVINGGRGCGVLGNVLAVLRRGDVDAAIRIIRLDSDKLHQYNADTGCFAVLQGLGLWRPEWPHDPSSPSPFDLLRVEAIKKFLEENPKVKKNGCMLYAVVMDQNYKVLGGVSYDIVLMEKAIAKAQKKGTSDVQIAKGLGEVGDEIEELVYTEVMKKLRARDEAKRAKAPRRRRSPNPK